mmetsp:Transcript_35725/g.50639  ORF Transcript_35725/g.50639 Transcript_35725/m.50639 type:complete len:260 (-) Transcript_35725:111-890(-)
MNRTGSEFQPTGLEDVMRCLDCEYDRDNYNIFHFAWCVQERWHVWAHAGLGGFRFTDEGERFNADFDGKQGPISPIFVPFHNTVDMFSSEWMSRYVEWSNVSWGFPYKRAFNYALNDTYDGINLFDTISSSFPMRWYDLGWIPFDGPGANKTVTYFDALCATIKQNADHVYVKFSGAPDGAPGEIVEPRNMSATPADTNMSPADETAITWAESNKDADLLPAAEAFLKAYDTDSDNRLDAAEAFLEELLESSGEDGKRK